jgi:hypothetical protein
MPFLSVILMNFIIHNFGCRESAVGIETGYAMDGVRVSVGRGKNLHFSTSSRLALELTQPPIQWVLGTLSSGIKWLEREDDHSLPASAEVKDI